MQRSLDDAYRCPRCREAMSLTVEAGDGAGIAVGWFGCACGLRFPIDDGIPDLTYPRELPEEAASARAVYDRNSEVYDEYVPLTFQTFGESEWDARDRLVAHLRVEPAHSVLEIGCGTGRDSALILQRLDGHGRLAVLDLSPGMLRKCRERLDAAGSLAAISYGTANACYLPFPDNSFDRLFHFGGINNFPDVGQAFREFDRVTRPGGRIVVGDESMPPWLRETEFARVLTNSNPLYRAELPLSHLPVTARNVELHWIIGGVFYIFAWDVGEGEPTADFDFRIPGARGGTHRTRYYGQLEGVTPEVKALAQSAREKAGTSMHDWLDRVVREAARRELE